MSTESKPSELVSTERTLDQRSIAISTFSNQLLSAPFGTLSKTEIEFLAFRLLVETGEIDLGSSDFVLSNRLLMTPARVRNLLYRYDQRLIEKEPSQLAKIIDASNTVLEAADRKGYVNVHFRRVYIRDYVVARLLNKQVIAEDQLTPGLLKVPIFDLFDVLGEVAVDRHEFDKVWNKFSTAYAAGNKTQARQNLDKILTSYLPSGVGVGSGLANLIEKAFQFKLEGQ